MRSSDSFPAALNSLVTGAGRAESWIQTDEALQKGQKNKGGGAIGKTVVQVMGYGLRYTVQTGAYIVEV